MGTWVFAYGSLVWNPEFDPADRALATLRGYRRAFCMSSIHHRGSVAEPGLVLALDTADQAQCRGMALEIPAQDETAILAALHYVWLAKGFQIEPLVYMALVLGLLALRAKLRLPSWGAPQNQAR